MPISVDVKYKARVGHNLISYELSEVRSLQRELAAHVESISSPSNLRKAVVLADAILSDVCHQMEMLAKQGGVSEVS